MLNKTTIIIAHYLVTLPFIYIPSRYYGLAAAAALLSYLESSKRIYYAPKSLKVDFGCSSQATMLGKSLKTE